MSIFHHTISRKYRIIKSKRYFLGLDLLILQSRDTYISFFGKVKEGEWKDVDVCVPLSEARERLAHAKLEETMHKYISADEAIGISVTVLPKM